MIDFNDLPQDKIYFQDDDVVIYCADCREILPKLPKVDLVLTDPPYGIGEAAGKNLSRGKWANPTNYGVEHWDDTPISQDLLDLAINCGNKAIVFGGNYYHLPPAKCWLIWDKENGANDFADCEMAWTNLNKAVRLLRYRWAGMLQGDMKNKEYRYHPTQKPLPVMKWCVQQAADVGLILDPFMGSGTTLRAALDLGRKCIGIEISEKYCEIAKNRLRQSVMKL
uniref:Putative methyltransferase n=1 Tax=viral metagenome TaxID=1070528 RepID=A0A6M3LAF6_9ZZZZ